MHLFDLPHVLLVLRRNQTGTGGVAEQLLLVRPGHATDLGVFPLGRVLFCEKGTLLVTVVFLHLLVLLLEGVKLSGKFADTLALAGEVLEELSVRLLQVLCRLLQLMGPF